MTQKFAQFFRFVPDQPKIVSRRQSPEGEISVEDLIDQIRPTS
jgi:hypothetical protein